METAREGTLVLGIGNLLMGDDGAGIEAVRLLGVRRLPDHIMVAEAGMPGWGLASWVEGWPSVVIVDAVRMGGRPGTWQRFGSEAVRFLSAGGPLSLHESDLAGGLALADALGLLPPQITFFGVEPERTDPGTDLSPAVRASLPGLVEDILECIAVTADERE